MFTLYDLTVNRSEKGHHLKNPEAEKRAEKRRLKARCAKVKKLSLNETTVVTKPTLDEEIKQFKAIVRHIMKYEAEQEKAKWFRVGSRASLRRLSNLGISGHQPSIMAYSKMTKDEKDRITEAILKQKSCEQQEGRSTF